MKSKFVLAFLCLILTLLACGSMSRIATPTASAVSLRPPMGFQEADLIGTWVPWAGTKGITDTLILRSDKTFKQLYAIPWSGLLFETEGTWWIEYRSSGCVYLHVEGMRYYYGTGMEAESGNRDNKGHPVSFWSPCEDQTIQMPDSVVLAVGSDPSFPNGIQLTHMTLGPDESWRVLWLVAMPAISPTPLSVP